MNPPGNFTGKPQLNVINSQVEKQGNLEHFRIYKGLEGTFMNGPYNYTSLNREGHLKLLKNLREDSSEFLFQL